MAIATVALMSCGGNKTKEMIAKKWQISEFKADGYDEQMAQMKAMCDTMKDSTMKVQAMANCKMMEQAMEEVKKSTLEYKNDGTYEGSLSMMGQTQNLKGTWVLTADSKKMVMMDDAKKDKPDTLNVDEISADKFVSSGSKDGKKTTIVLVPMK